MKEAIIIGGGNSVREGLSKGLWDKIKGKEVWSLNYAYKFIPYLPTRQFWVDVSFFREYVNELQHLYENGVHLYCKTNTIYDNFSDKINLYKETREAEHARLNPEKVFVGAHSLVGVFALDIACKMSYDVVYLLGYDYGTPDPMSTNTHWYQDNVKEYKIESGGVGNINVYRESNRKIKESVKNFEFFSIYNKTKIFNVNPLSNISYFEFLNYDEFFERINE